MNMMNVMHMLSVLDMIVVMNMVDSNWCGVLNHWCTGELRRCVLERCRGNDSASTGVIITAIVNWRSIVNIMDHNIWG